MTRDLVFQHVHDKEQTVHSTFGVVVLVLYGIVLIKGEPNRFGSQCFTLLYHTVNESFDLVGDWITSAVKKEYFALANVNKTRDPMLTRFVVWIRVKNDPDFSLTATYLVRQTELA